jgi:hypothetical protein
MVGAAPVRGEHRGMKSFRLLLVLVLGACAQQPAEPQGVTEAATQAYSRSEHEAFVAAVDAQYGGTEKMPEPVLRRYCMSAYWARRADRLESCLAEVEGRRRWLAGGDARPAACASGNTYAGADRHACDLMARELHLRALSALDRGEYGEAARYAAELRSMRRENAGSRYEAIDALGVLLVSAAHLDDARQARAWREEFERFGTGPFSGLHYERIWLARGYLAMHDYPKAYDEVRRLSFGVEALVPRTAAVYAQTNEAAGYLFILHKSELETGHFAEAKAGFEELLRSSPALPLGAASAGLAVSRRDLEGDLARAAAQLR